MVRPTVPFAVNVGAVAMPLAFVFTVAELAKRTAGAAGGGRKSDGDAGLVISGFFHRRLKSRRELCVDGRALRRAGRCSYRVVNFYSANVDCAANLTREARAALIRSQLWS